jgi:hypothetical protein
VPGSGRLGLPRVPLTQKKGSNGASASEEQPELKAEQAEPPAEVAAISAPPAAGISETAETADDLRDRIGKAETIEQVVKLVAAAGELANAGIEAMDVPAFRTALELKCRAERSGGRILRRMASDGGNGSRVPIAQLGISYVCKRWREMADLDDEKFEEKVAAIHTSRWPPGVRHHRKAPPGPGPVRTTLSGWQVDEATGVRSRTLQASGEQPRLQGERGSLEI